MCSKLLLNQIESLYYLKTKIDDQKKEINKQNYELMCRNNIFSSFF